MIYENELIQMYSELEKNPVKISYPKGQPSNYPMTPEVKQKLKNFMWDNRFETIYNFGPCKVIHYESRKKYGDLGVQELRFYTDGDNLDFASLRYYQQTDEMLDPDKKQLMQLYQNVKNKLFNRNFTNPFQRQKNPFQLQK